MSCFRRILYRDCGRYATFCTKAKVKAFDEIPGPRGIFGLGNFYNYLPLIGRYSFLELHKSGLEKYNKYGPIVRETMVPGVDVVWLYDPNDIATLLSEKSYPCRRSHLALEKYRKDRPHIYRSGGLLPTNGPEWWRLRSELQKQLSAPKSVRSFLPDVNRITNEFLDTLPVEMNFDLLPELSRLNLELTCLLTFGERLNSFDSDQRHPDSRASKLITAAEVTNSNILPTDQGFRLWRYFETPSYKKLRKAQNYMESVAIDLVTQKLSHSKKHTFSDLTKCFLMDEFIKNPHLDESDLIGTAADLLLAGIDTTSYTTSYAVYYIATHPEVQEKLFKEADHVLSKTANEISEESLRSQIPYTRAVLKESFRLNPVSVGFGRVLNSDQVLSGYNVPKGTVAVTQNMITSRLEKYFAEPNNFDPERWLEKKRDINPHIVLPFGHGMRACIARRLAEQNMLVFLLKFIRQYHLSWSGDDVMEVVTLLINKPKTPVRICLTRRN